MVSISYPLYFVFSPKMVSIFLSFEGGICPQYVFPEVAFLILQKYMNAISIFYVFVFVFVSNTDLQSLCFPCSEIGKGKLTVGKIYGGLLILENWKTTKFGKIPNSQRPVNTFSLDIII